MVFSFANGIVHAYYTVALAPAIGACIGIGATLLWQRRFDVRAATALSGTVLVTSILAAVLLSRHAEWMPWLRALVAVGGVGAAALLFVAGRLSPSASRLVATLAVRSCLAAPAAYSIATAATAAQWRDTERRPVPTWLRRFRRARRLAGLAQARARSVGHPRARRGRPHLGSGRRRFEQRGGLPTGQRRACHGDRGIQRHRSPPTLEEFQHYVATGRIHYFIRGRMMIGHWGSQNSGSQEAADIAEWVEAHYTPLVVERVVVYDLTQPPKNS